jgi:hypothetical protein
MATLHAQHQAAHQLAGSCSTFMCFLLCGRIERSDIERLSHARRAHAHSDVLAARAGEVKILYLQPDDGPVYGPDVPHLAPSVKCVSSFFSKYFELGRRAPAALSVTEMRADNSKPWILLRHVSILQLVPANGAAMSLGSLPWVLCKDAATLAAQLTVSCRDLPAACLSNIRNQASALIATEEGLPAHQCGNAQAVQMGEFAKQDAAGCEPAFPEEARALEMDSDEHLPTLDQLADLLTMASNVSLAEGVEDCESPADQPSFVGKSSQQGAARNDAHEEPKPSPELHADIAGTAKVPRPWDGINPVVASADEAPQPSCKNGAVPRNQHRASRCAAITAKVKDAVQRLGHALRAAAERSGPLARRTAASARDKMRTMCAGQHRRKNGAQSRACPERPDAWTGLVAPPSDDLR